jgi:hypothetical protein
MKSLLISLLLATNNLIATELPPQDFPISLDETADTRAKTQQEITSALAALLHRIGTIERLPHAPQLNTHARQKAHHIQMLLNELDQIRNINQLLPEFIKAAQLFDKPHLLDALLWKYATTLKFNPNKQNKNAILNELHNATYLQIIANAYFLQFDEDIDSKLGLNHQRIDFDTLDAYHKFPAQLLRLFPNLKTNPNELRAIPHTSLSFANSSEKITGLVTALAATVLLGEPKTTQALLRLAGLNVNFAMPTQRYAILYALGNAAQLKLLVNAGATVDVASPIANQTPLMLTLANAHEPAARVLITAHANVNARDDDGKTPLMMAAWAGTKALIPVLVSVGADMDAHDLHGYAMWSYARN